MNRVELSIRSFFWILFSKKFAEKIDPYFAELHEEETIVVKEPPKPEPPKRSDAIQLLAILQREGRLVDFLKEPIESYTDAQIGAAVRDVHRDCASVLERVFSIESLVKSEENSEMSVVPGFDPQQYRLTGNISGTPPYKGVLRHHGWKAQKVELPVWQGAAEDANVVAPAEVEIR